MRILRANRLRNTGVSKPKTELFGIPSGDFQRKYLSADEAFSPDLLWCLRVVLFYLKTNSSQSSLAHFQNNRCRSQATFCYLYQGYTIQVTYSAYYSI